MSYSKYRQNGSGQDYGSFRASPNGVYTDTTDDIFPFKFNIVCKLNNEDEKKAKDIIKEELVSEFGNTKTVLDPKPEEGGLKTTSISFSNPKETNSTFVKFLQEIGEIDLKIEFDEEPKEHGTVRAAVAIGNVITFNPKAIFNWHKRVYKFAKQEEFCQDIKAARANYKSRTGERMPSTYSSVLMKFFNKYKKLQKESQFKFARDFSETEKSEILNKIQQDSPFSLKWVLGHEILHTNATRKYRSTQKVSGTHGVNPDYRPLWLGSHLSHINLVSESKYGSADYISLYPLIAKSENNEKFLLELVRVEGENPEYFFLKYDYVDS